MKRSAVPDNQVAGKGVVPPQWIQAPRQRAGAKRSSEPEGQVKDKDEAHQAREPRQSHWCSTAQKQRSTRKLSVSKSPIAVAPVQPRLRGKPRQRLAAK